MQRLIWTSTAMGGLALIGCTASAPQGQTMTAAAGCASLGDARSTLSSFYEPGQVYAAEKVERTEFRARAIQPTRTAGAELRAHAAPGVTAEYLERALTCHAVSGAPQHPSDPLHPSSGRIADVDVRSSGTGFVVSVIGDSPDAGNEIWQRARAFSAPGAVTVEQVAAASETPSSL